MTDTERWLNVRDTVRITKQALRVSAGTACVLLVEACESGAIRARWPIGVLDSVTGESSFGPRAMPRSVWQGATIDPVAGEILTQFNAYGQSSIRRERGVEFSADDLVYWLIQRRVQRRASIASPPAAPSAPAAPTAAVPSRAAPDATAQAPAASPEPTPRARRKPDVEADKELENRLRSVVASAEKRLEANPALSERQLAKLLTQAGKFHGFGTSAVRQIIRGDYKAMKRLKIPGLNRGSAAPRRSTGHR